MITLWCELKSSKTAFRSRRHKNIITSLFSTIAPLIGGYFADFFATPKLNVMAQWDGPHVHKLLCLMELHDLNFLFLAGAFFAFIALQSLIYIKEKREAEKEQVKRVLPDLIGHLLFLNRHAKVHFIYFPRILSGFIVIQR
jgi:hypothetical protein